MTNLGDFPLDDVTLDAIETALGASLTFEDGADEPALVGAPYSLHTLLDFLSGVNDQGVPPEDNPHLVRLDDGMSGAPVYEDERPRFHEHDVIRAMIAEIRRLRAALAEPVAGGA